jgi:hypothetical protein
MAPSRYPLCHRQECGSIEVPTLNGKLKIKIPEGTQTDKQFRLKSEGISGRVKFLLLAWAGMPKTSFRKNSDSPPGLVFLY